VFFNFNVGPTLTALAAALSSANVTKANAARMPFGVVFDGNNSILVDFGKSFFISDSLAFSGN